MGKHVDVLRAVDMPSPIRIMKPWMYGRDTKHRKSGPARDSAGRWVSATENVRAA